MFAGEVKNYKVQKFPKCYAHCGIIKLFILLTIIILTSQTVFHNATRIVD